ncbi:hypothetical protein HYZ05_03460 [Candidatus Daviesbacteria bacterium]|nr:hypothetical protein [Candidatus Daviesbacteria bacterium]
MTHIVKRKGHKEIFDERKVYASVLAACLSAHVHKEQAEINANMVTKAVKEWLDEKMDITSDQIFKKVSEELKKLHKDAAFMYTTHRDIS